MNLSDQILQQAKDLMEVQRPLIEEAGRLNDIIDRLRVANKSLIMTCTKLRAEINPWNFKTMPETDEDVLIFTPDEVKTVQEGFYSNDLWFDRDAKQVRVICWQPYPAEPEPLDEE